MHAVTVTFRARPNDATRFLAAIQRNAALSLLREPGCKRFDVCVAPDDPATVFLYELYVDEDAFELHKTTAHFKAFDAETRDWVTEKTVSRFTLTPQAEDVA
ncbi:MAG: antibiotic biosynthesis monooxygenase [Roseivivax sp.]|nr:antibiotic biosynthesis monooxygenase [Roseivivax sp.]